MLEIWTDRGMIIKKLNINESNCTTPFSARNPLPHLYYRKNSSCLPQTNSENPIPFRKRHPKTKQNQNLRPSQHQQSGTKIQQVFFPLPTCCRDKGMGG